jgi:multicomponent Na+:H+ antiporter subunit G
MPLNDIISIIIILLGVLLIIIASIGIVRLPDFYLRMSAITKAATLGLAFVLIGLSVHFNDLELTVKSVIIISLVFLTSPVGAHAIARAAYKQGVQFWEGAVIDELKDFISLKEEIESKLKIQPNNIELHNQLITVMMKLPEAQGGSLAKAKKIAKKLVEIDSLGGHRRLAEIYLVEKIWNKADEEYALICDLSGYKTDDVQRYVKFLFEKQKYNEASAVVARALKINRIPILLYLGAKISAMHGANAPFGLQCARELVSDYPEHPLYHDAVQFGKDLAKDLHEKWPD